MIATGQDQCRVTVPATATVAKYRFVTAGGAHAVATDRPVGVTDDDYVSGDNMAVVYSGIAVVQTAGAISVGGEVTATTAGKALAAVAVSATVPGSGTTVTSSSAQPAMTMAGSALPAKIRGLALDASSGSDEYIRILLV